MADPATLLTVTIQAIGLLLILVLWAKLHPFLSLLITAIFLGISSGMPLEKVSTTIQNGLGGTWDLSQQLSESVVSSARFWKRQVARRLSPRH
nr:hypothetical protein [Parabacteroides johnsonii]